MKRTVLIGIILFLVANLTAQEAVKDTIALKKFRLAFKDQGGRWYSPSGSPFNSYLRDARIMMAKIHTQNPNCPEPYVDFVNSEEFNAAAIRCEGQYLIGVNRGAIEALNFLCFRLLASNKTFPKIGSPSREKSLPKINIQEIYSANRRNSKQNAFSSPVDSVRELYAGQLITILYQFIISHEYCHIRHGHVAYEQSVGLVSLYEISNKSYSRSLTSLDCQTMEMDADSYAAVQTLGTILKFVKNPRLAAASDRRFYANWQTAFRMWLTAVYVQWRSLSYMNISSSLATDNHPLPGLRMELIGSTIYQIFDKYYKTGLEKEIDKIIPEVMRDVEYAFSQITTDPLDYSNERFQVSTETSRQSNSIMKNWNVMRPQLLKYACSSLAPVDNKYR